MSKLDYTYLAPTIGQDEATYQPVSASLYDNLLIAGRTGSGVFNTVNNVLADVAGKPFTELLGIDPLDQLSDWGARFATLASTPDDISALLVSVDERIQQRHYELSRVSVGCLSIGGSREPSDEMPLVVLVIRELLNPTLADQVLLSKILRTGRAAGIRVVMAGQCTLHLRPDLRTNFGTVVVHAMQSAADTQRLLGPVAASAPAENLKVNDPADRGLGYVVNSTGSVTKFRAPYFPFGLAARIAGATSALNPQSLT